jgi:hypothetical protein
MKLTKNILYKYKHSILKLLKGRKNGREPFGLKISNKKKLFTCDRHSITQERNVLFKGFISDFNYFYIGGGIFTRTSTGACAIHEGASDPLELKLL